MSSPRKSAAPKLPFPDLPECGHPFFSLVWYLRQVAKLAAITPHWKALNAKPRTSHALLFALIEAETSLEDEVADAMRRVVKEGHLLFAFPGTTVLQVSA